jgi:hypothetical protein
MQYFHHGQRLRKSTGCDRVKDAQDVLRKTLVDPRAVGQAAARHASAKQTPRPGTEARSIDNASDCRQSEATWIHDASASGGRTIANLWILAQFLSSFLPRHHVKGARA